MKILSFFCGSFSESRSRGDPIALNQCRKTDDLFIQ
jgi:hypothetical protein